MAKGKSSPGVGYFDGKTRRTECRTDAIFATETLTRFSLASIKNKRCQSFDTVHTDIVKGHLSMIMDGIHKPVK